MPKMEHLWNELTKHDGLIIVKFLGSTIYQFYFVKILLVIFVIIELLSQMIQIHLLMNELTILQFIQYTPAFLTMFYLILAAIILLIDPKLVENLFKDLNVWPIDTATDIRKKQIAREMKIVSFVMIINTILTLSLSFAILIFNRCDYATFLPIKYFTDYYPEYSNTLTNIFKCTYLFILIGTAHAYQLIYYTQHFKYQFWILIDLIGEIMRPDNFSHVLPSRLIEDHEYQQEIKLKLIGFVKRHQELLTVIQKKNYEISNYIIYFSFCGLLVITSVVYAVATDSFFVYDYRYLPILNLVVAMTIGASLMAGQSIETVTEDLHYFLQQLDWYNMNIENRRIYLVLTCAQKKISMKFSEKYSINYTLGLAVIRGTYSVMSILAGFNTSN